MSQVERKRVGVKLDRRRLKEMLAEEVQDDMRLDPKGKLLMDLDEENSLRSDLHLPRVLSQEELDEEAREAFRSWEHQFHEELEYDRFLAKLDKVLLEQDYDEREMVSAFD